VLIVEEPLPMARWWRRFIPTHPTRPISAAITGRDVKVEALPDQGLDQASQQACRRCGPGRFFVYGAHDAGRVPHGVIPIKIEAGLAFGTGHHETTAYAWVRCPIWRADAALTMC
jgi:ribosomal protein L11 methyltransferase